MRWALGGLAVLAGIGVGGYMGANHITPPTAGQAARQAFASIGSLVKSMTGGAKSATGTGSAPLGAAERKDTGTTADRAVTTDNTPPPDPTILDGVEVRYDPYKPSDGPYPQLSADEHVWVDVSIDQQLLYILNGDKVIYTMVTSTGLDTDPDNSTPLGTYHVQAQRGMWFYSQEYSEGAQYWTSWLGHGIFLFHTVPMNSQQQIIPAEAALLGHKASHGCFHLTIPDAQWVYTNIPEGTTVVVEQAPVILRNGRLYQPSAQQLAAIRMPYVNSEGSQGATGGAQGSPSPQNARV